MVGTDKNFITRIDAALTRVEAALQSESPVAQESYGELAARHERLRAAVSSALSEIDTLIGGAVSGPSEGVAS